MPGKNNKTRIDWMFLLFLAGATYVKLYVKFIVLAVYLLHLWNKNYSFKRMLKPQAFYLLMPLAGLTGALIQQSFDDSHYLPVYLLGTFNWLLASGISYCLYLTVVHTSSDVVVKTLKAFFLANIIVSLGELGRMIIDSGMLVPYWDWGENMYYGGATGDHILGITGNISVTNAMISALGAIFFTFRKDIKWAVLCIVTSLLCTSNLTLIFVLLLLLTIVILYRDVHVKKYAMYIFILCAILYPVLTYDNVTYVEKVYVVGLQTEKLTEEQLKEIEARKQQMWVAYKTPEKPDETIQPQVVSKYRMPVRDSVAFSFKQDLVYSRMSHPVEPDKETGIIAAAEIKKILLSWYGKQPELMPLANYKSPVKLYTFQQTYDFLTSEPRNAIAGAGTGNFSSKLAIKTLGFGIQGNYPLRYLHVDKNYMEYHLYSLFYVLSLPPSEHSIINMPGSVYNQVAGEYGLMGILLFVFLYLGFIWQQRKALKHGMFIALLVLGFMGFEYWFEMISLTVIFELLIYIEIYGRKQEQ